MSNLPFPPVERSRKQWDDTPFARNERIVIYGRDKTHSQDIVFGPKTTKMTDKTLTTSYRRHVYYTALNGGTPMYAFSYTASSSERLHTHIGGPLHNKRLAESQVKEMGLQDDYVWYCCWKQLDTLPRIIYLWKDIVK